MDSIKVTANGNFDTKDTWQGIQKHLEHDPEQKHENEFLNSEESKNLRKFNRVVNLINYEEWTNEKFEPYVVNHDLKNLKKGRFVFGNVKNFLRVDGHGKVRARTLDKLYSMKFSDEETYKKISEKITDSLVKSGIGRDEAKAKTLVMFSDALVDYAKGFNSRNKNLKMFKAVIHMDEEGAPHFHSRVMPFVPATTENGKPSWSLNKALKTTYECKDTRENLKKFREQEDQAMIDSVNKTLQLEMPEIAKNMCFELTRRNASVTGLKHEVYREKKHLEDVQEQTKQAEEKQKQAQAKSDELDAKIQEKTAKLADYDKRSKELDKRELELNNRIVSFNKTVDEHNKEYTKKVAKLDETQQKNDDLTNELNNQLIAVKSLKQRLNDRIKKVEKKTKDIVKNWRYFAFNLAINVYNKAKNYFFDDYDLKHNDALDELQYYDKHIDEIPSDFNYDDWFKHKDDKQFSWLTDHQDDQYNKVVSDSEKIIKKHEDMQKKAKDLNNDGIDDDQEDDVFKQIDISSVDPILDLRNQEQGKQDQNEKY